MGLYSQEPLNISHHRARFDGHGHFCKGDIMVLVCYVILEDHVIKELCDCIARRPLCRTIMAGLVIIDTLVVAK